MNQYSGNIVDTENLLSTKQFNTPVMYSSVKKKALADVKNTLYQRSTQSCTKPKTSLLQPNNPQSSKNRRIFKIGDEFKTEKTKNKNDINTNLAPSKEQNIGFVGTCKCDESPDAFDNGILFEGLTLSYNDIENFALNWEPQKLFTPSDKRDLCPIEGFKEIEFDVGYERDGLKYLYNNLPEITFPEFNIPEPRVFEELNMISNTPIGTF